MKEVEVLVEVFSEKSDALNSLKKFNFVGEKKVLDIYFHNENDSKLQPKNGHLTECFRLRKRDNHAYIAYKTDYFKEDKWAYSDELETEVNDFETTLQIIFKLGLKKLVEINNTKHTFLTDKYEIILEEVEELGLFLEVERLAIEENENINEVKKEIMSFINSLEIKTSTELNAGKPELMLNNNYD